MVQIDDQDDGGQFKSVFHWDMKSRDGTAAPNGQPLMNEVRGEIWMGLGKKEKYDTLCKWDALWVLLLEKLIQLSFTQFVIPALYRRHFPVCRGVISTVSASSPNSLVSLSLPTTVFLSLGTTTQAGDHGCPSSLCYFPQLCPLPCISLSLLWYTSFPAWTFVRASRMASSVLALPLSSLSSDIGHTQLPRWP